MRVVNSAGELAARKSTFVMEYPPESQWTCASLKPGNTDLPPASTTRVFGPANAPSSAVEPTAVIRFPETATASAFGCVASIVRTAALTMMRSGAREGLSAGAAVSMANKIVVVRSIAFSFGGVGATHRDRF